MTQPEPPYQLKLLGGFELHRSDGSALELSGKKARALFAYLAVESGRPHARERLAGLLWGDMSDDRARHNLRQALSRIRRYCEAALVPEGDTLRFDDQICAVDVLEFLQLSGSDDPEDLLRALSLYDHDLLEGFVTREEPFEDWLAESRRHFRQRACDTIDRLSATLAGAGRLDEAMEFIRRRLAMDPACEEAHRALMKLLARTGRRSEALRQYEACCDVMQRQLGARPSPETVAAYEEIRDGSTAPPAAPREPAPAPPPSRSPGDPPSVAVLPFENLMGAEHQYFSDGITDDIITSLSRFGSLTVISRFSSFAYRDRHVPVQEIGRELGAQFLLQGSAQRQGSRMRINVQLLEADTGKHIWAQRFDREMEELFEIQDEVSQTVVSTLAGRVEAARLARARAMPTESLDAHDFLLRGKEHYYRHTAQDCEQAIHLLERAIELDPGYAVAHAWLACARGQAMGWRPKEHRALMDAAYDAASRGLDLNSDESECHRILAQVFMLKKDLTRAISHNERAVALNPNDDRSVGGLGEILVYAGRPEDAEEWVRKAMRLNPYHGENYWFHLGRSLLHSGRSDEALAAFRNITRPRARELAFRVVAAQQAGSPDELERSLAELHELKPQFDPRRFVNGLPYVRERDQSLLLESLQAAGL